MHTQLKTQTMSFDSERMRKTREGQRAIGRVKERERERERETGKKRVKERERERWTWKERDGERV